MWRCECHAIHNVKPFHPPPTRACVRASLASSPKPRSPLYIYCSFRNVTRTSWKLSLFSPAVSTILTGCGCDNGRWFLASRRYSHPMGCGASRDMFLRVQVHARSAMRILEGHRSYWTNYMQVPAPHAGDSRTRPLFHASRASESTDCRRITLVKRIRLQRSGGQTTCVSRWSTPEF